MEIFRDLKTKIFADIADLDSIKKIATLDYIKGFTTNPSLMKKAGVKDYENFAKALLKIVPDRAISFEVFSDSLEGMERQAHIISKWGRNIFVKIPITNTKGESSLPLIKVLSKEGLPLNITAMTTVTQVSAVSSVLSAKVPNIISILAGRIADTGRDPVPMMRQSVEILRSCPRAQLLWASPRELFNLFQAEQCECHIITLGEALLNKISMIGRELEAVSLETVKMFYDDAQSAGYKLKNYIDKKRAHRSSHVMR